ncbi:MAG TPA: anaerobic sulfatase maturase [Bryobacteraceae bacterium]|nr:anaerobic sulfatase maturase [Bryobacteraceae bacterium]
MFPVVGGGSAGSARIQSLLIKPVSGLCNLDCSYCFYLDREADPYGDQPSRRMSLETLERLVDTWLFYSFPASAFAFQGGEPTLAALEFYQALVGFQKRYGRDGQSVSNSIQTNAVLLDDRWCSFLAEYNWLVGVSLDGPEDAHDLYRRNRAGHPSWKAVMASIELLRRHKADFNILCVLNQANAGQPRELYRFFRGLGIEHIQYIPLAEFDAAGRPLPFTITPAQYGKFLCDTFDIWWPDRRRVRIRWFDNAAEALAGRKPSTCTLHEMCDSYLVVEHNGDVFPCDFFVEKDWLLGNVTLDSWTEIARRRRRLSFALNKSIPHPECQACAYEPICRGGCPKHRYAPRRRFEDLDYFCQAYKMIYAKCLDPLRRDVRKLLAGPAAQAPVR